MAKKTTKTDERAIWRGNVSFGLVQIPVGLYRAEHNNELHFTMLDKHNKTPIRYDRKNSKTGKPLKYKDIVKGYEVSRGHFVVMSDEDFQKASPESTGNLDIQSFVQAADIDPLYFVKPYYLLPQKGGEMPYALLRETLHKAGKVAVGKIIIRTRQHLALLRVAHNALVLHLIRFAHELREVNELNVPKKTAKQWGIGARELRQAQQLVASMSGAWRPEQYKDTYHDALLKRIRQKKRAGKSAEPIKAAAASPKPSSKVVDIMDLLQRSVKGARGAGGASDATTKTSAKTTKTSKTAKTTKTGAPKKTKAVGRKAKKAPRPSARAAKSERAAR